MAGEAAVAHAGISRRRLDAERPKRLIDGVAVGHVDPGAVGHGGHVAQVVGVQREALDRIPLLPPLNHSLAVGAEGHTLGDGGVRAAGNLLFVVGERRVDVRAVGVEGSRAVAVGVVFGCSGAGCLLLFGVAGIRCPSAADWICIVLVNYF